MVMSQGTYTFLTCFAGFWLIWGLIVLLFCCFCRSLRRRLKRRQGCERLREQNLRALELEPLELEGSLAGSPPGLAPPPPPHRGRLEAPAHAHQHVHAPAAAPRARAATRAPARTPPRASTPAAAAPIRAAPPLELPRQGKYRVRQGAAGLTRVGEASAVGGARCRPAGLSTGQSLQRNREEGAGWVWGWPRLLREVELASHPWITSLPTAESDMSKPPCYEEAVMMAEPPPPYSEVLTDTRGLYRKIVTPFL